MAAGDGVAGFVDHDRCDVVDYPTVAVLQRHLRRPISPAGGGRQTGGDRVGHFRRSGVAGCRCGLDARGIRLAGAGFQHSRKAARRNDPGVARAVAGRLGVLEWSLLRGAGVDARAAPTDAGADPVRRRIGGGVAPRRPAVRRVGRHGIRLGRRGPLRAEADRVAARVRPGRRAVRDHAGVARGAVGRSLPTRRRPRYNRGDVRSVDGRRHRAGRPRGMPRCHRAVRRDRHREVPRAVRTCAGRR